MDQHQKIKKYTVYKFPTLNGSPKHFRTLLFAFFYAICQVGVTCELENHKTGKYNAYWI